MEADVEISPSHANDMVLLFICGFVVSGLISKFFRTHDFVWMILIFIPVLIYIGGFIYIRAEKIVLGKKFISHRSLGFFRLVHKSFLYEEIDFWKMDGMALVVVRKGGEAPALPANTFWGDYSKVMLIPASGFGSRIRPVIERLKSEGVPESK